MSALFESLKRFFKKNCIDFKPIKGKPALEVIFGCPNGRFPVIINADDEKHFIQAHTLCPLKVTKAKLSAMAELIAWINWELGFGNFDIHMAEGVVAFRTSIKLGKVDVDDELITDLILGNVATMNHFFPAIAVLAYSNISPEKAIAILGDCHSNLEPDDEHSPDDSRQSEDFDDYGWRPSNN